MANVDDLVAKYSRRASWLKAAGCVLFIAFFFPLITDISTCVHCQRGTRFQVEPFISIGIGFEEECLKTGIMETITGGKYHWINNFRFFYPIPVERNYENPAHWIILVCYAVVGLVICILYGKADDRLREVQEMEYKAANKNTAQPIAQ